MIATLWHGFQGGAKWASRPRVPTDVAEHRLSKCQACVSLTWNRVVGGCYVGTCGAFLQETDTTCGCMVAWRGGVYEATPAQLTISAMPAGKTVCSGETCPQGKWEL